MSARHIGWGLLVACCCCRPSAAADAFQQLAEHLGNRPALIVAVCRGTPQETASLATFVTRTPWTLFCRGPATSEMASLRDWARQRGVLGNRVFVVDDNSKSLYLASGLADAVWVSPAVETAPAEDELLRVLHAGGVYVMSGKSVLKPAAGGTDEWRHPYHGPDNNVVSRDRVARLPGELRFQTRPVFAAMPNQTLFAGGRIFFFSGHIAFHEREEPLLNKLTVLNAYNGLQLWSRSLDPRYVVHNLAKVATADGVVFAEGETLRILDAATGRQRGEFRVPADVAAAGDTDWKWIAQDGDTLWAAFGPPDGRVSPHRQKRQMGHWPWGVANAQYRVIVNNFGAARRLAAFQYPEMTLRWMESERDAFDVRTLCMEQGRVFLLSPGKYAVARAAATGKELWRRTPERSAALFEAIGGALKRQGWGLGWATYCCARAGAGVICIAGPPFKKTIGIDFAKGDLLWTSDVASPHPFFVDDALYVMPRVATPTAACRRIDPRTGQLLNQFGLGVIGSCTRLTVTPSQFFYRPGGGEGRTVYVDLNTHQLAPYEGIVRPGCFDGVVPANGRLYWMPLACDCWQVHGTFSMAPRTPLPQPSAPPAAPDWKTPAATPPATGADWPTYRADASGSATRPTGVLRSSKEIWRCQLSDGGLTAPICVGGRVFVGGADGTVYALDGGTGKRLWQFSTQGELLYPPTYWKGRIVIGSCDGSLYCVDAANGQLLGRRELAPEKRFVNIMGRFISAWPLAGGVVVRDDGIAYTAAGSTAADGSIVAAVDIETGKLRWQQAYTLDRPGTRLSFGVQSNLLLHGDRLLINGGAPVGIVALDAGTGGDPQGVAQLESGGDMFVEPDGRPFCDGPDLFSNARTRTTIFKQHQRRAYFQFADRQLALVHGRLFCARERNPLDRIVELMNQDPRTGGKMGGNTVPRDAMTIPVDDSILWAGRSADLVGLAVGRDGLVALHQNTVEGLSVDGESIWTLPLPAAPVRWGLAMAGKRLIVSLVDGQVVGVAPQS